MNAEQFTYWLNGFLEITNSKDINKQQTQIIKDHLALVFNKVTPGYATSYSPTITNVPYDDTNPFKIICGNTPLLNNEAYPSTCDTANGYINGSTVLNTPKYGNTGPTC